MSKLNKKSYQNLILFFINWAVFILSFFLIAYIAYLTSSNRSEDILLLYLVPLASLMFGFLYSLFNFMDDTIDLTKEDTWIILSIIGGALIFAGITIPIFYLKRKKLSALKKYFILLFAPILISLFIYYSISVANYFIYPSVKLEHFIVNIEISSFFSVSMFLPTLLLGLCNPKVRKNKN